MGKGQASPVGWALRLAPPPMALDTRGVPGGKRRVRRTAEEAAGPDQHLGPGLLKLRLRGARGHVSVLVPRALLGHVPRWHSCLLCPFNAWHLRFISMEGMESLSLWGVPVARQPPRPCLALSLVVTPASCVAVIAHDRSEGSETQTGVAAGPSPWGSRDARLRHPGHWPPCVPLGRDEDVRGATRNGQGLSQLGSVTTSCLLACPLRSAGGSAQKGFPLRF